MVMTAEANKNLLMRRVDLANSEIDQDILIKEACSDRAAFARLYRMHYERVFRYCCRRLFNRHAAEDVTSEVFFRVMRTISTFDGNSNGFRNWLYRIATNAVNDHLKTAKRRAETISGNEQATIVVSDFRWDAQIDPATFASVIPEGYELMYKVNAENLEEGNQLVDGLKYFAQINDGKYPAKLSIRDVLGELGNIYRAKSGDPSFQIDDAQVSTLKYGAQFFGTLESEGKEPVYSGATVTAADVDKVLVRWKLDDGRYRVIFGDLRIEDVSAGRLAELEAK